MARHDDPLGPTREALEWALHSAGFEEEATQVLDDMVALGTLLDKLSPGQLADDEIQNMMGHLLEDIGETVGEVIAESGDRDLAVPYGGFVQAFEQALGEQTEIKEERLLAVLQEVLG